MLTATPKFHAHLRMSHSVTCRAGLWLPGEDGAYEFQGYLGVAGGELSIDWTRQIRRQVTRLILSTLESTIANRFAGPAARSYVESLTTQSAELTIEWGLRYPDGDEWVQIARLRVEESVLSGTSGSIDVTAYDPATRVADFDLVTVYAPYDLEGAKLTYLEAIQDLVDTAYPSAHPPTWHVDPSIDDVSLPPDGTAFTGARWDAIDSLAAAIDAEVYTDANGDWWVTPITRSTAAVWLANAGQDGVLVDDSTRFSRREQYNAVAIRWENPTNGGGLVFLVDADPTSPTYYDGPFGRKPRPEETVATITTEEQAIAYATSVLGRYTGRTKSIDLTTLHNPLLEPGDVIGVRLLNGTAERHIVDSIRLPFGDGTMTIATRVLQSGVTYAEAGVDYADERYTYLGVPPLEEVDPG
jgi:hypothetical protein